MTQSPRIASLLPSATEICCALGLDAQVVGVSHECDFPRELQGRPVLTRSSIDTQASSAEIDRQVREQLTHGLSLYHIEEDTLREVQPNLIVTQDTCQLCAVSFEAVEEATCRLLGTEAEVVSLEPLVLEDVLGDVERVGCAAGVGEVAQGVVADMRERFDELAARTEGLPRPKVLGLEWLEPPMVVGHWTPELLRRAGGEPVLAHHGRPTVTIDWEEIAAADPDVVLLMPCGFEMKQTLRELSALYENPLFQSLRAVKEGRVVAFDGNSYFNRPGPRLVRSAELAALAIHPEVFECEIKARSDEIQFDPFQQT